MKEKELVRIYQDAYDKAPDGSTKEGAPYGSPSKKGAGCTAVWNAALDHAADSFASQAGQMQMSVEQRLLITVAQRIRAMKR